MKDISIIILSYNTADITKQCLDSLLKSLSKTLLTIEIIVIDNASSDTSIKMLENFQSSIKNKHIAFRLVLNKENIGYPAGNNQGIKMAQGRHILLLNSDVIIKDVNFDKLVDFCSNEISVGGIAIKLLLPNGGIDPASHRGFPTPWNAFCYYSKLEKVTSKIPILSRLFGGYHLTYLSLDKVHEIDSPNGAFFLIKKDVLNSVKGFDEQFFMYGEDLDLSYRIKKLGYKILYYPFYTAVHLKHTSGLKGKDPVIRRKTREKFYEAMKIFYKKHYQTKYPAFIKTLTFFFIDWKKKKI